MSWDTLMPILVRNVIGDTDPVNPKYTDDALNSVVLTAAQLVVFRLGSSITQRYTIDNDNLVLTPDPTVAPDNAFINLVTLKTAYMLLSAEVRQYGQQAIAIRDGTSAIDLKRDLKALLATAQAFGDEYDKAVANYLRGDAMPGEAIVGPFKSISWTRAIPYPGFGYWTGWARSERII